MTDTDRILEALNVLQQQIANVECELAGVRADLRYIGDGQEITKKKSMIWSDNSTPVLWNFRASAPGARINNASKSV